MQPKKILDNKKRTKFFLPLDVSVAILVEFSFFLNYLNSIVDTALLIAYPIRGGNDE
jgi:hypothetical protein